MKDLQTNNARREEVRQSILKVLERDVWTDIVFTAIEEGPNDSINQNVTFEGGTIKIVGLMEIAKAAITKVRGGLV